MNFINLRIAGEKLDLQLITKMLNIKPDYTFKQGDSNIVRGEKITYSEDSWICKIKAEEKDSIEELFCKFTETFYKHKDFLNSLAQDNHITFWLDYYPDDIQTNIHFPNDFIKKIAECGIDMDISVMCMQQLFKQTNED